MSPIIKADGKDVGGVAGGMGAMEIRSATRSGGEGGEEGGGLDVDAEGFVRARRNSAPRLN
jgi:hypothetical protein